MSSTPLDVETAARWQSAILFAYHVADPAHWMRLTACIGGLRLAACSLQGPTPNAAELAATAPLVRGLICEMEDYEQGLLEQRADEIQSPNVRYRTDLELSSRAGTRHQLAELADWLESLETAA